MTATLNDFTFDIPEDCYVLKDDDVVKSGDKIAFVVHGNELHWLNPEPDEIGKQKPFVGKVVIRHI